MNSRYFTTGYVYLYSLAIVLVDTLTFSRDSDDFFSFELFSMRVLVLFSYWLTVKNLSGLAQKKGMSYKLAMVSLIFALPITTILISLLLMKI